MAQASRAARPQSESALEKDVFDVKQVMYDYVWALDTSDWERLRRVFADDVIFNASNMGHYQGGDLLVREFQNRTVRTPIRRHMVASSYVTVNGDIAIYTSYLINVRVRPGAPGGDYYWGTGYYRNSFRRTADGWKMFDFKWEAISLEGNTQLIPAMGPMIYLPVMKTAADAPWGGASAPTEAAQLSNSQQIQNLIVGLTRSADVGQRTDVVAALDPAVKANLGEGTISGLEVIADALCSRGTDAWKTTFLTNVKVSVVGNEALYGAYVYVNSGGATDKANHAGGVLTATARKSKEGWKVSEYTFQPLWDRSKKMLSDRALDTGAWKLPSKLWSMEDVREQQSDEEELIQLMSRYTWAYDLNDVDQQIEIFHPETDSSFHMAGSCIYNIGRDALIQGNRKNRKSILHAQHYVFNPDIQIGLDGNSAFMRVYAQTRRTHDASGDVAMAGGFYHIHARRYDGRWRFDSFRYQRAHEPFM